MNSVGVWLIVTAVVLGVFRWAFNWRAERRYMRNMREQNKRESITSLVQSWKRNDQADALRYNLQARKRELQIKESARQQKAYYDSLHSEENIGVTLVKSGPFREIRVEDRKAADYRPTLTQSEVKIAAGIKRANERKEEVGVGLGYDLGKIAKEYGLTLEEMKKAYDKAEAMVSKNFNN